MKLSKLLLAGALSLSFGATVVVYAEESSQGCSTPEGKVTCAILRALQDQVSSGGFQASRSDIQLKQDIKPLQESLDKVSRVGGYSYSWRSDSIQGHLAGQTEYGVIAQEIQTEFPQLVQQDDEGYLRVDYRGLIPVLLESIKELKMRVEALEAQLEV